MVLKNESKIKIMKLGVKQLKKDNFVETYYGSEIIVNLHCPNTVQSNIINELENLTAIENCEEPNSYTQI